jgi:hypothetical protein
MTEQNTEAIEDVIEAPEVVSPIVEPQVPTKSRKVRSEMQLKALKNARQKAYNIRAEKTAIKKAKNESKKTEEVSIQKAEVSKDVPAEIPDELPEIVEDVKKEAEPIAEETYQERIERHAERQQFNDHINSIIDNRIQYKPIVKSKFKQVEGMYVIRD